MSQVVHGINLRHELQERTKELQLMHSIAALSADVSLSTQELLQKIAELVVPAWQYPDDACCGIRLGELEVCSPSYRDTPWMLKTPLQIQGAPAGVFAQVKPPLQGGFRARCGLPPYSTATVSLSPTAV